MNNPIYVDHVIKHEILISILLEIIPDIPIDESLITIDIKASIKHHYIKASAMIIPKTHIALITNATAIKPVALPFFNSLNSF